MIGNPEGLEGTVSDGIISAFRSGRNMIQITAPISPGSSGSPVLDETGQVIGMATLVSKEGENLNFAISTEVINKVIQAGLTQVTPTPIPKSEVRIPDEVLAHAFYSWAVEQSEKRNVEAAIKNDSTTIEVKPDFADAYSNRGWCYIQLGLYEKAIMDVSEAIRLKPDYADAYHNRAIAYHMLGDDKAGLSDLKKAKQLGFRAK